MIRLNRGIAIDDRELEFDFIRSSGPGGQNVNKVSTAVRLRFDARGSSSLPEDMRAAVDSTGRQARRRRRLSDHPRAQRTHPGVKPPRRRRAPRRAARKSRRATHAAPSDQADHGVPQEQGSRPNAAAERPSRRGERELR